MSETHTPSPRTWFGFRPRTLAALVVIALVGVAALGADLAAEGMVYDLFWQTTGETEPLEQILGFGQYLVRWTRLQPETDPYAAVPDANVSPYGVNTFLDLEAEPAKREMQVQMIADAGFDWIRQQFRWDDLEIHGKGDFEDRRNDLNGDGSPDAVSAWDKYDNIAALAAQYNVQIMARLSDPPAWSQPDGTTNPYTPPADFQDFVDYVVAVAQRYQGQITVYQVWNEPNLYPEWGDQTVNAEAYTDMLCRTYSALKAVDPDITVVTGAIGPTVDLSGRNAYDLLYVQRMYQAGAGGCFDVLSVQGYGLWSGPTDQRLRQMTVNYQRHLWLRDMMIANGDAGKPIWISEAGWNPVPDDPTIDALDRYGRVTMDQAAEWAPLAYARATEDWPWIGGVFWWYFKRPDTSEQNQSWYYFRLVEPDFTPTPVYNALKEYITNGEPKTLGAGRHGALRGDPLITREDGADTLEFHFKGTGVSVCLAPEMAGFQAAVDGGALREFEAGDSGCAQIVRDLAAGTHDLRVQISAASGVESLVVIDSGWRHQLPVLLVWGWGMLLAVVVLAWAILKRVRAA